MVFSYASVYDRKEAFAMKLWDLAHSRTGDKGNISNLSLIAYDPICSWISQGARSLNWFPGSRL